MRRVRGIAGLAVLASLIGGGALALALLLGAFGGGSDAQNEGAAASAPGGSGFDEGIQVHGDWVIEVRHPDGSLAERREFQNALTQTGQLLLTGTLAKN